MDMLAGEATLLFLPSFSVVVNSYRKDLRVDPMQKNYLIHRSNQEFMQINIILFSEGRQGVLISAVRYNVFPGTSSR